MKGGIKYEEIEGGNRVTGKRIEVGVVNNGLFVREC